MPNPNRPHRPNTNTTEDVARHYSAAMDSVNLINEYLATPPENTSPEDVAATIARNVEHLKIMVAKTFWTAEDLTPLNDAITAGTPPV
jgi:hypothetical protein